MAKSRSVVDATIKVPAESRNKYAYDRRKKVLRLERVLDPTISFPANYGFVEETSQASEEPADILIWTQSPLVPSCSLRARVFGAMRIVDGDGVDTKLLAVADKDPAFEDIADLADFDKERLAVAETFFREYKKLGGKAVTKVEFVDRTVADDYIATALRAYWENVRSET